MKELSRTHRVSINAITNYARFFMTMIVSFLLIPFIIRSIGDEDYGLWTLTFSIIGFFSLLDFGFGLGVVKWTGEARVNKDYEHRNQMLSTVFFIYLAIAGVGMLLLGFFSLFYPPLFDVPEAKRSIAVYLLMILGLRSLLIQIPMSLFKGVLFGEQRIYMVNVIQVFGIVLYAGSAWFVLSRGMGVVWLGIVNCGSFLVENILFTFAVIRSVKGFRIAPRLFSMTRLREAASFSFFSFISAIAGLVLFQTDAIIIQLTMSLSMVALYAVALKITEYSLMLTKQLVNVLTPLISELKENREHDAIRFLLIDVSKYIMGTGVVIAGSVYVFGGDLLIHWVGQRFLSVAVVLNILITAYILSIPELVASNVLTMTGHHRFTAKVSVSAIFVNIGVSLSLVGWLGLTGIALGTLASVVVNNMFVTLRRVSRVYGFPYHLYFTRVFLPALLPGVSILGIGWYLRKHFPVTSLWDMIGKAIPGILVYLLIFWIICVDRSMKRKIMDKLGKVFGREAR